MHNIGHCTVKHCQGKKHGLGETIPLPDQCGELVCIEGLVAEDSPLLPGASPHLITHPDELTLAFRSKFPGSHCCILPVDAEERGEILKNQSMVQEGKDKTQLFQYLLITITIHHRLDWEVNQGWSDCRSHLLSWSFVCASSR